MKSVTCFGGVHHDVKARLAGPLVRGSSNPVTTTRTPGGVACNVARSLARLGVPVHLVSIVGEGGAALLDGLAAEGVDVSGVSIIPDALTASYTAVLGPDGSLEAGIADMTIYDAMDRAWGLRAPPTGDLWFVDANIPATGLEALRTAAAGRLLFVDPVSVAKAPRTAGIIPGAAAVFPDAGEARALTGCDDPAAAASELVTVGAGAAIVTLGRDGVVVAGQGESVARRPAIAVGEVVDVTGAGDAFAAGYLAAVALDGDDPVAWGLAAASLAIETIETVPSELGLPAVLARL